ncbi:thioredoxin [Mariniluteicoccus endophyticus]
MATIDLTTENFTSTIKDNDFVVVDFWAGWCTPCQRFAPIFSKVAEKHDDVVFAKLDTEAEQAIAGALGVQSIPTVMAFNRGNLVFNQTGVLNASQLDQLVNAVKEHKRDAE